MKSIHRGWAVSAADALALNGRPDLALIDLRERSEVPLCTPHPCRHTSRLPR